MGKRAITEEAKIDKAKALCAERDYSFISRNGDRFDVVCSRGHASSKTMQQLGFCCRKCYEEDMIKQQIAKVKKNCKKKNIIWIDGKYESVNSIGTFECQNNHIFYVRFGSILTSRGCEKCRRENISKTAAMASKIHVANSIFRNINKEIQYYRSRQNVFDDLNKKIKHEQLKIKKRLQAKKDRERFYDKYHNDKSFRMNELIKSQIKKCIIKDKPMGKYYKILGWDTHDLIRHLESKFRDGMSWENMGEWHIDHVVPKSWFTLEDENGKLIKEEFRKCWSLENLQPLWGSENSIKGNRFAG